MKKAISLLDEILDASIERDLQDKRNPYLKVEDKIGESFITFHLKSLKQLLEEEEKYLRERGESDVKSN
tara:strand:+ start:146 stop:352 length:207 start_codon:yes stop_codon:yes gene_type:complete